MLPFYNGIYILCRSILEVKPDRRRQLVTCNVIHQQHSDYQPRSFPGFLPQQCSGRWGGVHAACQRRAVVYVTHRWAWDLAQHQAYGTELFFFFIPCLLRRQPCCSAAHPFPGGVFPMDSVTKCTVLSHQMVLPCGAVVALGRNF